VAAASLELSKVESDVILFVVFGSYCASTPAARLAACSAARALCAGSSSIELALVSGVILPAIFDRVVDSPVVFEVSFASAGLARSTTQSETKKIPHPIRFNTRPPVSIIIPASILVHEVTS